MPILVEDFKELLQVGLVVAITVKAEDLQESLEIHFGVLRLRVDNMENFSGLFFKSERLDGCGKLFSRDIATLVVVKNVETFLESHNVISGQVLGDVEMGIEGGWLFGL